jgi:hypothetical protein
MAKKTTAKKAAKKPASTPAKNKTGLRKTIQEAVIWEGLITDSGLDVERNGLLAAEFAGRAESTLADIWADLESARSDLEAIIRTHGDSVTPSELRKLLAK